MTDVTISTAMRAYTITKRGPPSTSLKLRDDCAIPSLASDTSLLVRISHVSIHPGNSLLMHIVPMFLRKPPFLAETDFSGTVVAVGSEIASSSSSESCDQESCFAIGNQVFGSIPVAAHLKGVGALAEYAAVEAKFVAIKPDNVTMADASCLLVSAITAIDIVDLADLKPGYRVLINAPCGGIGNFATQVIRRATGSEGHIVGICSSANNELAKKLGCDRTESYGLDQESLVRHLSSTCEKEGLFDMIIDCHGSQKLWLSAEKLLKSGSGHHYVTVGPRFPSMTYSGMLTIIWQMITNLFTPVWLGGVNRSYKQAASFINQEKLQRVRKLAEDGVIMPHVGGVFKFEDAKEAYGIMMNGHARGKIVIEVENSS